MNSPVTGEFPAQRASNAENASIWWRHHDAVCHQDHCCQLAQLSANRAISQIPECICPISHNAPLITEMYIFLFWMEHCGYGIGPLWDLWIRSITGEGPILPYLAKGLFAGLKTMLPHICPQVSLVDWGNGDLYEFLWFGTREELQLGSGQYDYRQPMSAKVESHCKTFLFQRIYLTAVLKIVAIYFWP